MGGCSELDLWQCVCSTTDEAPRLVCLIQVAILPDDAEHNYLQYSSCHSNFAGEHTGCVHVHDTPYKHMLLNTNSKHRYIIYIAVLIPVYILSVCSNLWMNCSSNDMMIFCESLLNGLVE